MKMRNVLLLVILGYNYVNLIILRLKYVVLKCFCVFIIYNNDLKKFSEMLISFYLVLFCDQSIKMS